MYNCCTQKECLYATSKMYILTKICTLVLAVSHVSIFFLTQVRNVMHKDVHFPIHYYILEKPAKTCPFIDPFYSRISVIQTSIIRTLRLTEHPNLVVACADTKKIV